MKTLRSQEWTESLLVSRLWISEPEKVAPPSAWEILKKSPGLEDLWQLHYVREGGPVRNVSAEFIANLEGTDAGNYLKLTAWSDGTFEMFDSRTKMSKTYRPDYYCFVFGPPFRRS